MPEIQFQFYHRRRRSEFRLSVDGTLSASTTVILGANGAGKSTLIGLLATAQKPTSGIYNLDGLSVLEWNSGREEARERIGWLPQVFGYDPSSHVIDYLTYMAWLKGVSKSQATVSADRALTLVGLGDRRNLKMRQLSGGMLRRVGIAQAIVADADVISLDEPSAGLDPHQRAELHALIRAISGDRIVVIATHLVEDLDAVADFVMLMRHGEIVEFNSYDTIKLKSSSSTVADYISAKLYVAKSEDESTA